jgi:ABC-type polar amino acid transport system ATPase subunit
MIELMGLTKRHDGRAVLAGVTTRFARGRITAVVGPSGGGKSTLLRCIVGLEAFDAGEVLACGQRVGPLPLGEQKAKLAEVRRRVGLVFQAFHLFGHRTALGNVVEAPIHVKKASVSAAMAEGRALLEKVGLAHRAAAYPHELSGGEQQRVAIARALAMEPDALLLDEPTSALDPERTAGLFDILGTLREEGKTLVIVTHEMAFAARIADHVVVLHGGEVVEEGAPKDVLAAPKDARTRAFLAV